MSIIKVSRNITDSRIMWENKENTYYNWVWLAQKINWRSSIVTQTFESQDLKQRSTWNLCRSDFPGTHRPVRDMQWDPIPPPKKKNKNIVKWLYMPVSKLGMVWHICHDSTGAEEGRP